jgi:hypothetical protein
MATLHHNKDITARLLLKDHPRDNMERHLDSTSNTACLVSDIFLHEYALNS